MAFTSVPTTFPLSQHSSSFCVGTPLQHSDKNVSTVRPALPQHVGTAVALFGRKKRHEKESGKESKDSAGGNGNSNNTRSERNVSRGYPQDFSTAGRTRATTADKFWGTEADLTALSVPICAINRASPSGDLVSVFVDVRSTGLANAHLAPGQFVQICTTALKRKFRNDKRRPARAFVTIASPPGAPNGIFEFLVCTQADPAGLTKLKVGDRIRISPVMGRHIEHRQAAMANDVVIFVDAPQGLAAAKSFVENESFRAASGTGTNRRTRSTIYYAVPTHMSMGYVSFFSKWLVYGVTVVPILGESLEDYIKANSICGKEGHMRHYVAIACVSEDETFERLFWHMRHYGLPQEAVQSFTQNTVEADIAAFDADDSWQPPAVEQPSREKLRTEDESVSDAERERRQKEFEEEVWESWVKIRDAMRIEFEKRWASIPRNNREKEQEEREKQQAWASWFGRNYEQWNQAAWDDQQWSGYWSYWGSDRDAWTAGKSWKSNGHTGGGSSGSDYSGYSWSQQNSQEYWDWVGRGTGPRKSASSSHSNGNSWNDPYAGYSGAWGNGTGANTRGGYQDRGYQYQYRDEDFSKWSKKSASGSNGTGFGGGGTGWSGWSGGQQQRGGGQKASGSGWGGKNWTDRAPSQQLDFYAILDLESNASFADIKRAYRKKAMEHHPDRNPNSQGAHEKMQEIVVAYTVLKDENKRKRYDIYGASGL